VPWSSNATNALAAASTTRLCSSRDRRRSMRRFRRWLRDERAGSPSGPRTRASRARLLAKKSGLSVLGIGRKLNVARGYEKSNRPGRFDVGRLERTEGGKMKAILILVITVIMLAAGVGEASAQAEIFGDYPAARRAENPYARQLEQARAALDRSIQNFWAVYYSQPYDYWRVVDAYYAYVNAYYTYRHYLDLYWRHERGNRAFAGRIMVDNSRPGVVYIRAPIDPVPGATVVLTNVVPVGSFMPIRTVGRETTDSSGNFEFRGLAAGRYGYTVTKSGYLTERGTVEVGDSRVTKTIFIRKTRRLAGTVVTWPYFYGGVQPAANVRLAPRPVSGARVTMTYLNARAPVALVLPISITDAQGRFHFDNLIATSVKISVEAPGFRRHEQTVTIDSASEDVRITLTAIPPYPHVAAPAAQGAESNTTTNDVNNPFGQ
jgi:hypothetical protein